MQSLSPIQQVALDSLPSPSPAWAGAIARLTTNNKPYWCDGTAWIDMTGGAGGSGLTHPQVLARSLGC